MIIAVFSLISPPIFCCGAHLKRLSETLPMSSKTNVGNASSKHLVKCFHGEKRKITPFYAYFGLCNGF